MFIIIILNTIISFDTQRRTVLYQETNYESKMLLFTKCRPQTSEKSIHYSFSNVIPSAKYIF